MSEKSGEKSKVPVPQKRPETEKFWEGCKEGKLLLQKCNDCGEYIFYPRALCPHCMSQSLSWVESSGRGEVYTFSIHHRGPTPGFKPPYVVALIDLEEGVRIMSNVIGCDPNEVKIGMKVKVTFEQLSEDIYLPKFVPA
ncbi:putative OB-fold protein [Desulfofundulus luciae]|uniref:OB-fold protein n=1 Tax=Desulfofundulus luciae TaxID=74702 RepID=A0ABU0B5V9_9FIRM|nr:Zn-ribbon domain-containing OB-fold protein [Desulfofundulus luciae]MDQ0287316.1 putative OB-fold protein [Desulfofundulus luciae]